MATTVTNINMARVDNAIQAALKNALVPLNAFSIGVSTVGMIKDDIVRVPVLTDPEPQAKTLGTAVTSSGSIVAVNVTLDTVRESKFDLIAGIVPAARLQAYAEGLFAGGVYAIAKEILDNTFALLTAANYATKYQVSEGDMGQFHLAQIMKAAETKKLGRQRSLLLNAGYAAELVGSSSLGLILATLGDNALKTAKLPNLIGMTSYMYSGLAALGENLGGAVIDKTAIAVAISPIEQFVAAGEADCIMNRLVTEPDSGITVNVKLVGDADGGKVSGIVSAMHGVKKIQDAAVRIVTA
jgi:hypothetical protein